MRACKAKEACDDHENQYEKPQELQDYGRPSQVFGGRGQPTKREVGLEQFRSALEVHTESISIEGGSCGRAWNDRGR